MRSPQNGLPEVSQHHQVKAENGLTWRCEPACAEIKRTVLLHVHPASRSCCSFQMEQWGNFSHEKLFLLINELHYIAAAIYSL